jgi:hypothetical protein
MIGLFRTIFFLVVIYYLIRFVSKILVPYFRAVTEINNRQKVEQNPYIQYKGPQPKKSRSTDGDYVDYKEVE